MNEFICIRCYVHGKVQGVWFRASTKDQADQLDVTGWAKNLPDGKVEVVAYGDKEKVMQLYQWLHQGPPLAKVDKVTFEELPIEEYEKFKVL